ncbi:MAG: heme-binding protein [Gammaproteobacteria bacterium]
MNRRSTKLIALAISLLLTACGGGHDASTASPAITAQSLTTTNVGKVVSQAVQEAAARKQPATIAVVDRSGNVLAVFQMNGAKDPIRIASGRNVQGGLEDINVVPASLAAIAKAISGAYLSSDSNAFSTRTASQIIEEHFDPGELGQPGGPLFGVQFSSLPCSDLATRYGGAGPGAGPQRSPLGLAGDAGGFPLYKQGILVGGIGVMADGVYGIADTSTDTDDTDEYIALAATSGFDAPDAIRADRITVNGLSLHYSDASIAALARNPAGATPFSAINNSVGQLLTVTGYSDGQLHAGTSFNTSGSGVRADAQEFPGLDAYVLVDDSNTPRFPPRAGGDGLLSLTEVHTILADALGVASEARSQIRRPVNSAANVSISVVDTQGQVLGVVRSADAPVFGTDVSLQKARTAAFNSSAAAAAALQGAPDAAYLANGEHSPLRNYVTAVRAFLGVPTALADGAYAFSDRAGGNMARPFFPDGIDTEPNGPFGKPLNAWSPFSTGLQEDLVNNAIIQHIVYVLGGGADVIQNCTSISQIANGIQIFPGSVPIYRGKQLVGGIGVSGDGVDQDDLIAFMGLYRAAQSLGTVNEAPVAMRADQLSHQGVHLRFVQCPQAPYLGSDAEDVCSGK